MRIRDIGRSFKELWNSILDFDLSNIPRLILLFLTIVLTLSATFFNWFIKTYCRLWWAVCAVAAWIIWDGLKLASDYSYIPYGYKQFGDYLIDTDARVAAIVVILSLFLAFWLRGKLTKFATYIDNL